MHAFADACVQYGACVFEGGLLYVVDSFIGFAEKPTGLHPSSSCLLNSCSGVSALKQFKVFGSKQSI